MCGVAIQRGKLPLGKKCRGKGLGALWPWRFDWIGGFFLACVCVLVPRGVQSGFTDSVAHSPPDSGAWKSWPCLGSLSVSFNTSWISTALLLLLSTSITSRFSNSTTTTTTTGLLSPLPLSLIRSLSFLDYLLFRYTYCLVTGAWICLFLPLFSFIFWF